MHRLLRHAQAHQQVIISHHQWHASHVQQASSRTGLLSPRALTALPASLVLSKGPAAVAALELAPQGLTAPLEGVQQQLHSSRAGTTLPALLLACASSMTMPALLALSV
jgi:hypothetical protein